MLEEFEDTKVIIRIRISKKNRQYNGQKKKLAVSDVNAPYLTRY